MAQQWTAGTVSGQVLTAATLNTIGAAWETYTPALTASVTNPNLGSTGAATGSYARINKIVIGQARFTFNGVGINAGAGFYFYSIPLTGIAGVTGNAQATDVSTFATTTNVTLLDTTTRLIGIGTGGGGLAASIQATTYPWAAGDFIQINFCYEAA